MACDHETMKLLSIYVDGEASQSEAARAEAHISECHECRAVVQEWRRGLEMLDWAYVQSLPDDVAEPAFETPIPATVRERRRWSFALPDMKGLAVAAVLVLILLTGAFVYRQITSLPTLGRSLATAQKAQWVIVAEGIRLRVRPGTEISRLGDKAIRLVRGTIDAEVTHGRGFTIRTRKLVIIDEGTKFQVHSDSRTDRVTVKEGSVLVREGEDEYHVGTGETLTSTGDKYHNETRVKQNGEVNMEPLQPHGGVAFVSIPLTILGILFLVFWVRMLVHALTREFKDSGSKIAWVIVILLWQGLGALIYYFVVYAKDHPGRPIRLPLVGRRGDRRVIVWWNVLLVTLLAVIVAAMGAVIFLLLTDLQSKLPLLIAAVVGVVVVVVAVYRAMKLPVGSLKDLDSGE